MTSIVPALGASYLFKDGARKKWLLLWFLAVAVVGYMRVHKRWFERPEIPSSILNNETGVDSVVPKDELLLIEGDESPNVYLYLLPEKNFNLSENHCSMSKLDLSDFKWFFTDARKTIIPRLC